MVSGKPCGFVEQAITCGEGEEGEEGEGALAILTLPCTPLHLGTTLTQVDAYEEVPAAARLPPPLMAAVYGRLKQLGGGRLACKEAEVTEGLRVLASQVPPLTPPYTPLHPLTTPYNPYTPLPLHPSHPLTPPYSYECSPHRWTHTSPYRRSASYRHPCSPPSSLRRSSTNLLRRGSPLLRGRGRGRGRGRSRGKGRGRGKGGDMGEREEIVNWHML